MYETLVAVPGGVMPFEAPVRLNVPVPLPVLVRVKVSVTVPPGAYVVPVPALTVRVGTFWTVTETIFEVAVYEFEAPSE